MIDRIALPTDLSEAAEPAFIHALRLALAARCELDMLHVRSPGENEHFGRFPHVRDVFMRWGLMAPGDTPADIHPKTGVQVKKAEINHPDGPAAGISAYIVQHPTGLVVAAPHQHGPLERLVAGSVSEAIALHVHCPTLFVGAHMRSFVDPANGALALDSVLLPVDATPDPTRVVSRLAAFLAAFGLKPRFELLHVGDDAPRVLDGESLPMPVARAEGPIPQAILDHADRMQPSLIAMATAGHDEVLDMVRGSTTERVMREASVPLLALPV